MKDKHRMVSLSLLVPFFYCLLYTANSFLYRCAFFIFIICRHVPQIRRFKINQSTKYICIVIKERCLLPECLTHHHYTYTQLLHWQRLMESVFCGDIDVLLDDGEGAVATTWCHHGYLQLSGTVSVAISAPHRQLRRDVISLALRHQFPSI